MWISAIFMWKTCGQDVDKLVDVSKIKALEKIFYINKNVLENQKNSCL